MSAVSDSSPLILFSRIGALGLLNELFGEILIPQAVWDEITVDGLHRPPALEIAAAPWIQVSPLTQTLPRFNRQLDRGEAEALALALELGTSNQYVIMDDEQGRKEAVSRELQVIGSAGVALLAKKEALVRSARTVIDELRAGGLYLTDDIVEFILGSIRE